MPILAPSSANDVPTAEPEYMTMGPEISNVVFHNKLAKELDKKEMEVVDEDEVELKMTDDEDEEEEQEEMIEEPVYINLSKRKLR